MRAPQRGFARFAAADSADMVNGVFPFSRIAATAHGPYYDATRAGSYPGPSRPQAIAPIAASALAFAQTLGK
jgi:hypothetical protein